jgi:hypothetical protein
MPLIAIALIVAAALGGGVSVAANSSLPGDALWGFKTSVNENVEGAFAMSDEAKANWDISVAAERLDEAQKLESEGKLTASAQTALTANFDSHAQDVSSRVAKLQAAGNTAAAADVATRFQATVAQHASAVVQANTTANADAQASIAPFLTDVRSTLDTAANLSASTSANAAAQDNSNASSSDNGTKADGTLKVNTGAQGGTDSGSASTSGSGTVNVNIY